MNIAKTLSAALLIIIFFSSCQKDFVDETTRVTPTPTSSASRPKTYSESIYYAGGGHDSLTLNLTYDASGRILSMISASSPGDKFVYQYSGNTINMDLYNSGLVNIHEEYYLNASSYIDSTFQYNDTKDTATEKYLYNGSNQLITLKEYDYSKATGAVLYNTTNYTYDAASNVIKDAGFYDVNTYTYTTLLNTLSLGFDHLPPAKYLPKTTTNVNGGVTVTLNHSYTFDSSNRLTSEKIVTSDGDIAIRSYTY